MSEFVNAISDDQFQSVVLDAQEPVLVDFWAPWCGPCRMLAPIIDKVAPQYAGRIRFVKMNVDENQETPAKYSVRGIPSLLLFKKGELADTKVGALTEVQLMQFLDGHI